MSNLTRRKGNCKCHKFKLLADTETIVVDYFESGHSITGCLDDDGYLVLVDTQGFNPDEYHKYGIKRNYKGLLCRIKPEETYLKAFCKPENMQKLTKEDKEIFESSFYAYITLFDFEADVDYILDLLHADTFFTEERLADFRKFFCVDFPTVRQDWVKADMDSYFNLQKRVNPCVLLKTFEDELFK